MDILDIRARTVEHDAEPGAVQLHDAVFPDEESAGEVGVCACVDVGGGDREDGGVVCGEGEGEGEDGGKGGGGEEEAVMGNAAWCSHALSPFTISGN